MQLNPHRIYALVWRHMVTWPRDLENLVDSFWWPSFDIFIWGLMTIYLRSQEDVATSVTGFIIGGIVLWMFVYRSQQEVGMMFLKEAWDRNLMSIIASPVTTGEFLAASLVLGVIKLAISGVWMSFLAFTLFAFNIFSFGLYLIPFIISLLLVGWWAGFIVNGLVIRYGWRVQALAWSLIIIIQPFSAVFYPVSAMPGWMQAVASVIPTSYIFEGMREVLVTGQMNPEKLGISLLLNLMFLSGSILFFRYCFRKAQDSGMIVKFS
jgi:ABC-2 type transport system permease protein